MTRHREPTIEELLTDPLTVSMMEADRVDAVELRGMLQLVARRLARRSSGPGLAAAKPAPQDEKALLRDCIYFTAALRAAKSSHLAS